MPVFVLLCCGHDVQNSRFSSFYLLRDFLHIGLDFLRLVLLDLLELRQQVSQVISFAL